METLCLIDSSSHKLLIVAELANIMRHPFPVVSIISVRNCIKYQVLNDKRQHTFFLRPCTQGFEFVIAYCCFPSSSLGARTGAFSLALSVLSLIVVTQLLLCDMEERWARCEQSKLWKVNCLSAILMSRIYYVLLTVFSFLIIINFLILSTDELITFYLLKICQWWYRFSVH